jgi:hypothetical protein
VRLSIPRFARQGGNCRSSLPYPEIRHPQGPPVGGLFSKRRETTMLLMRSGFFCLAMSCLAFAQNPAMLTVEGIDGKVMTLTARDLAALPPQSFEAPENGKATRFEGVRLLDVLAKVSRPQGHLTAAGYYLLAEARDGYRAVFAWSELNPDIMDKALYLATKRDGAELDEKTGPFLLVAPGEKRTGRWVRQLAALRLREAR